MTVFFFFILVFSLCLFCLPRNVFTFVLYYLAILAKHMNISLSASDGMRVQFLFAVRAAGTSEHAAGLDDFESSDRISACIVKKLWEACKGNHDEISVLATQCETPCATRLSYNGICTILRAFGTIYVIRKGPIETLVFDTMQHALWQNPIKLHSVIERFCSTLSWQRNRTNVAFEARPRFSTLSWYVNHVTSGLATVSRRSPFFSHLGRFVVRRDPHLFDLGPRGMGSAHFSLFGGRC